MSELTKDFLKFVMEVILFVIILATLFSDQGMASNTFNYLSFVEPILLQNWIASTIATGSTAPGDFISTSKTTGQPFTIIISVKDGMSYVEVDPPDTAVYTKTKFASIGQTPFVSECKVPDITIKLQKNLIQTVVIKKVLNPDGTCSMEISAPSENIVVGPGTTNL